MKKVLAFLLTVMLTMSLMAPALAASNKYGYDIDTAKSSVVRILVFYTFDDPYLLTTNLTDNYGNPLASYYGRTFRAAGSGFAVGDIEKDTVEYIVTAGHVLNHYAEYGDIRDTSDSIIVGNSEVFFHVRVDEIRVLINDASSFVLGHDAGVSDRADVAILRLNTPITQRKAAVLRNEMEFTTNTPLTTMGFPAVSEANSTLSASDQLIATTDAVTVGHGFFSRFSSHAVTGAGDQIQTNAVSDHGMSGGALVDDDGYVVGVVTSQATANNNINYAVATSEIIRLLNSLTDCKYWVAPLPPVDNTLLIVICIAAALLIILLIVLIIASSNSRKNKRVLVFGGVMAGKSYELKPGAPLIIGCDANRCKVIYPQGTPGVSRLHCTITYDGKQVSVADNGSSYGTYVGGVKVTPGQPMVIHRGQAVSFGTEKTDKYYADLH